MPLSTEDKLEIQELVTRYNHAVDSGDGTAYADTFTDDGAMVAGEMAIEGRQALEAFPPGFAKSTRNPRHIVSNVLIEGEGDKARLRAYFQMYATAGDPPRHEVSAQGVYSDELAKVNGQWRFVRRTVTMDG